MTRSKAGAGSLGLVLVVSAFVMSVVSGHAVPIKTWSGSFAYAAPTNVYGVSAQPFETTSPANDVISSSRDVSAYDDGHYRLRVRTDALAQPVSLEPRSVAVTARRADGTFPNDFPRVFGPAQGWSTTFCLPKDSQYLRVGPYTYAGFQQDVEWTIEVLDHTC